MRLEGDLNIKNIKALYNGLKDELQKNEDIIIEMKDVTTIDAAAAQLLLSATVKAKETGRDLRLAGIPDGLKNTFSLAGLGMEKVQGDKE